MVGVELDGAGLGKNNGSVDGIAYFTTTPGRGSFFTARSLEYDDSKRRNEAMKARARAAAVKRLEHRFAPPTSTNISGGSRRRPQPSPSSGQSARARAVAAAEDRVRRVAEKHARAEAAAADALVLSGVSEDVALEMALAESLAKVSPPSSSVQRRGVSPLVTVPAPDTLDEEEQLRLALHASAAEAEALVASGTTIGIPGLSEDEQLQLAMATSLSMADTPSEPTALSHSPPPPAAVSDPEVDRDLAQALAMSMMDDDEPRPPPPSSLLTPAGLPRLADPFPDFHPTMPARYIPPPAAPYDDTPLNRDAVEASMAQALADAMARHRAARKYESTLRIRSVALRARPELESGGKVLLPEDVLHVLEGENEPDHMPWIFRLTNDSDGRYTHCSVLEFTEEPDIMYAPRWRMDQLGLDEDDIVSIRRVALPRAEYVKIKVDNPLFLKLYDQKTKLETLFRGFATLTVGDSIRLELGGLEFHLLVVAVLPNDKTHYEGVCIIDTDVEVDLVADSGFDVDLGAAALQAPDPAPLPPASHEPVRVIGATAHVDNDSGNDSSSSSGSGSSSVSDDAFAGHGYRLGETGAGSSGAAPAQASDAGAVPAAAPAPAARWSSG
ncbi:uncharacterized protein AMSG_09152 [Thecamonas trahens ATCC 50062]|uniref:CAP-Gly domain-containing protein n=1 Tax=Thecamonas trahens ATCC 50062 TaxID=461836 RepID=A0A0L0DKY1_THETB|nr:hypothetical protein AMSG_09152 [Thecamonas trahens ATCC 50062]KNC52977.1 hypothetical protein AMSG_09152 [Thecamonas trahens ATCC 50062]|eukprot:XP_013754867.1 hypothetical protein AMSG_09152 [Thecamonas trahens ATCC 50062]